jgi:hypothetical protein
VTSNRSSVVQVDCCFIQWSYEGIISGGNDSTVLPGSVWVRFRQAKMCHSLSPLPWVSDCLQQDYPWVRQ